MEVLWFILIGIVAGWIAGEIWRGAGFGIVGNMIVGVIGALLGGYLFGALVPDFGLIGSLVTAVLGALVLLFLISLVRRPA